MSATVCSPARRVLVSAVVGKGKPLYPFVGGMEALDYLPCAVARAIVAAHEKAVGCDKAVGVHLVNQAE